MELEIVSISLTVWANLLLTLIIFNRTREGESIENSPFERPLIVFVLILMLLSAAAAVLRIWDGF